MEMDDFEPVEYPPKLSISLDLHSIKAKQKLGRRNIEPPLSASCFQHYVDEEGRILDEYSLRKVIFRAGISQEIRAEVWPYLFGLYQFNSTTRERYVIMADYTAKYIALKNRWKQLLKETKEMQEKILHPFYLKDVPESQCSTPTSMDPQLAQQIQSLQIQAKVYSGRMDIDLPLLISSIKVIDKDVPRTDRTTDYFRGSENIHLQMLRNILVTYAAYHPEVGYAQGMNDIVARFLRAIDDEVISYWCLVNYLEHMKADFIEDGMLTKLNLVRELLSELDKDLLNYLDQLEVGDLTFCHRWMLLSFKREFSEEDSNRCFEILSSRHLELSSHEAEITKQHVKSDNFLDTDGTHRVEEAPSTNDFSFEVFMCATVLMHYREDLFKCAENCDVFSLIASLCMNLNLDEIIEKTERLFYNYCKKSIIADCFQVIDLPSPENEKNVT